MYELVGLIGTVLAIIAYVPQVTSLLRTRSAVGIDIRSWALWMVATTLILIRALHGEDAVFKMLAISNVTFATMIFWLVLLFQGPRTTGIAKRGLFGKRFSRSRQRH